jgi:hypothetical protein
MNIQSQDIIKVGLSCAIHKKRVTIQPCINVIGRINSPVLFNDTYLLNFDEIDGNGISIKNIQ